MKSISEIILQECLPQRDCMLTLQDVNGEVGFCYFKDGELIEANYSSHWGKDAVEQVLDWELAEHTVGPLPMGIKRSVWDPVEVLLRLSAANEAALQPEFKAERIAGPPTPYDDFKLLPGVTKIFLLGESSQNVVYQAENESQQPTDWMSEFYRRAKSVGDTLGFGKIERCSITTDRYQVVGLSRNGEIVGVLRKHELGTDDFEAACEATVHKTE